MDQINALDDNEYSFLCNFQKIKRYGTINNAHSNQSVTRYKCYYSHKVEPVDTLQGLELRYNCSMFEIKRINKLWCDQSLHCKTHVLIPLCENMGPTDKSSTRTKSSLREIDNKDRSFTTKTASTSNRPSQENSRITDQESENESLEHFLQKIDLSVEKTKRAVLRKFESGLPLI